MKGLHLYATCATMYGSLRAGFRCGDMDALPGTKFMTIVLGGLYGTALLPIYIVNDLNRAHIFKNNLKYSDYGYSDKDTTISDVIFH